MESELITQIVASAPPNDGLGCSPPNSLWLRTAAQFGGERHVLVRRFAAAPNSRIRRLAAKILSDIDNVVIWGMENVPIGSLTYSTTIVLQTAVRGTGYTA